MTEYLNCMSFRILKIAGLQSVCFCILFVSILLVVGWSVSVFVWQRVPFNFMWNVNRFWTLCSAYLLNRTAVERSQSKNCPAIKIKGINNVRSRISNRTHQINEWEKGNEIWDEWTNIIYIVDSNPLLLGMYYFFVHSLSFEYFMDYLKEKKHIPIKKHSLFSIILSRHYEWAMR